MYGKNTIVRSLAPRAILEDIANSVGSGTNLNQGDLVVFDTSTKLVRIAATEAEGATFLGTMRVGLVAGKLPSWITTAVDAVASSGAIPGPVFGVHALCVAKTGITLAVGDKIYLDPATGSRGVTNTGTKIIGVYQGPAVATTVAGQEIVVDLMSNYPSGTADA